MARRSEETGLRRSRLLGQILGFAQVRFRPSQISDVLDDEQDCVLAAPAKRRADRFAYKTRVIEPQMCDVAEFYRAAI